MTAPVALTATVVKGTEGAGPAVVRVDSMIRGLPDEAKEVTVWTGEMTSCYVGMAAGERWLVLGTRKDGAVWVSFCGGSRKISPEVDRLVDSLEPGPNLLVGRVVRDQGSGEGTEAGVVVTVTSGDGEQRRGQTDERGGFAFAGLRAGVVRLAVEREGWSPEPPKTSHSMTARGCVDTTVTLRPDNEISGSVRDRRGRPVSGLRVEAAGRTSMTDKAGRFTLRGLSPGEYDVGVRTNPLGEDVTAARRVKVGQVTRLREVNIEVGEGQRPGITIEARLEGPEGQGVPGAQVRIADPHMTQWVHASKDSRITLELLEGEAYELDASTGKAFGSVRFTARGGEPVKVVLKPRQ